MSKTVVSSDFSSIVSNFNNNTSISDSWKISFNGSTGICVDSKIYANPNIFGNNISYDNGLVLSGSNSQLTISGRNIYSNPGIISMEYIDSTYNLKQIEYKISGFGSSSTNYFVSYDLFEEISSELLVDGYNQQETFLGIGSHSGVDIGIVILKAPSKLKITNQSLYVNKIHSLGAVGDTTFPDITNICESDILSNSDRIISLVYRKEGKYYNLSGEIDLYNNAFKYFGSGTISELKLTKLGTDGRRFVNVDFTKSKTSSTYILNKINSEAILNEVYYPTKSSNLVFDSMLVSNTSELSIKLNMVSDGVNLNIIVSVVIDGKTYESSVIKSNDLSIFPKISMSDFNDNVRIDSYEFTYDTEDVIESTDLYKMKDPIITLGKGSSTPNNITLYSSNNEIVIDEGEVAHILIKNINKNVIMDCSLLDSNNNVVYSIHNSNPTIEIMEGMAGKYYILAQVRSNGSTLPSQLIKSEILIYTKASSPIINYTINKFSSSPDLYQISYTVSNDEHLDCHFTVDGSIPSLTNGYVSKYINGYPTFTIDSNVTIKAIAYGEYYSKSDISTINISSLNKSLTLPTPVITNSTANESSIVTISNGAYDVYYTLDGTTPTINSIKYIGPFTISSMDSDSTTVKAISILYGANDSNVTTKIITFQSECASWVSEKGILQISDNKAKLFPNTIISRYGHYYYTYDMKFTIVDTVGNNVLYITPKELMKSTNNYDVQVFDTEVLVLRTKYSNDTSALIEIGTNHNIYNQNKIYGSILWNKSNPLNIKYSIISEDGILYNYLTVYDIYSRIVTKKIPIDVTSTKPLLMLTSINGGSSSLSIGNVDFMCN